MPGPFEGKVAVVTGSSRGIGKVIALTLAQGGADVVLSARTEAPMADRTGWSLEEAVAEVQGLGRKAIGVRADVTSDADLKALIDGALKEYGHIDILVNNAAMMGGGAPFLGGDPDQMDQFYQANLRAPYRLTQMVGGIMAESGGGTIVNITSGGARLSPPPGDEPWRGTGRVGYGYGIAKAALDRFATAVAGELKAKGIAIINVDPGLTRTERNQLNPGPGADYTNANDPDVTAKAIAFMLRTPMSYTGRIMVAREVFDENKLDRN